jgi:disulfide oxidoreductase YuzD
LTIPSPYRFFEVFNIYLKLEGKEKAAVLFLIEMCSFDYSMIKYKPSLITTGCLMLIVSYNKQLKELLFLISNYSNDQIAMFCKDLFQVYYKVDHGSKALKRKFSNAKYYEIAKLDIIAELNERHNQMTMENQNQSGYCLRSNY